MPMAHRAIRLRFSASLSLSRSRREISSRRRLSAEVGRVNEGDAPRLACPGDGDLYRGRSRSDPEPPLRRRDGADLEGQKKIAESNCVSNVLIVKKLRCGARRATTSRAAEQTAVSDCSPSSRHNGTTVVADLGRAEDDGGLPDRPEPIAGDRERGRFLEPAAERLLASRKCEF